MNDALSDAEVSGFIDSEDVEEPAENVKPNFVDESKLFLLIEKKPPVQFGINNQNLDNVYHGHVPSSFGLALRKWIWGVNGLAFEMIMPTKTIEGGRTCASKESILTFLRKTCSFVSDIRLVHFLMVFSFCILTAFPITSGKKFF